MRPQAFSRAQIERARVVAPPVRRRHLPPDRLRPAVRVASTRTPAWVKAILVVVGVGLPAWWLADRHDRVVNQDRLAKIASGIAGRPVRVKCPGPLGRLMAPGDTNAGVV